MNFRTLAVAAALSCLPFSAYAQSTVADDVSPPFTSTGQNEILVRSYAVPGGTLDCAMTRPAGISPANGFPAGAGCAFVPGGGGSTTRYLPLTDGKTDAGVAPTGTATGGAVGVKRTAGTSLTLDGETASAGAVTDKVIFEFNLPATYIAGANIPVIVNANYTGAGTITAVSTTITAQLYTEVNGVEAAVTTSAAQQFTGTATNYTFTVTGTGLVPGQHVMLELVMLVTNSASTNVGHINSVAFSA